jgi:hypothetical protein
LFRECRQSVGGKDLVDCVENRASSFSKQCGLVVASADGHVSEACRVDAARTPSRCASELESLISAFLV